jgi:hypothetical protein
MVVNRHASCAKISAALNWSAAGLVIPDLCILRYRAFAIGVQWRVFTLEELAGNARCSNRQPFDKAKHAQDTAMSGRSGSLMPW